MGNAHPEVNFVLLLHTRADSAALPITYAQCQSGAVLACESFPALIRMTAYDTAKARHAADLLGSGWVSERHASAGLSACAWW